MNEGDKKDNGFAPLVEGAVEHKKSDFSRHDLETASDAVLPKPTSEELGFGQIKDVGEGPQDSRFIKDFENYVDDVVGKQKPEEKDNGFGALKDLDN